MCMKVELTIVIVLLAVVAHAGDNKWTSNGPYGGVMSPFTFHPENDSLIFALGGGTYRSRNGGLAWEQLPIFGQAIIRIHPKEAGSILGFTYEVWKSTDQGVNWQRLAGLPISCNVGDVAFDPNNPKILYAISWCDGVIKSTDAGVTWTPKNKGLKFNPDEQSGPQIEVDPTNGKVAYASTADALTGSGNLFKTTNGGDSWKVSSKGLNLSADIGALAVDPKHPETIYTGVYRSGVYKSADAGATWSALNCPECTLARQVYIDPQDSNVLYVAANEVLKSTNAGLTWATLPTPSLFSFFSVGSHPRKSNLLFIGGFGAGIFRSQDGGKIWKEVNNRIMGVGGMDVEGHPQRPGVLWNAFGPLTWQSTNGGRKWQLIRISLFTRTIAIIGGNTVRVHPRNPNLIVFAAGDSLAITNDGGKTWVELIPSEFPTVTEFRCRQCMQLDPEDEKTIFLIPRDASSQPLGVAKSTDQGKSWKFINSGLADKNVTALSIDPRDGSTLFAGTESGNLFRSLNGGKSWKNTSAGLKGDRIASVEIDPTNSKIAYVSAGKSVFKTVDGGRKWVEKNQGLAADDDHHVRFVVVAPDHPRTVFAGVPTVGLYVSTDAAENWSPFDSKGLPLTEREDLFINPAQPDTFILGTSNGVYSYTRKAPSNAPIIEQVSPAGGKVGDTVTINGRSFGSVQADSRVSFGGTETSTNQSWSDTRIVLAVPSGARTGPLVVTVASRKSNPFDFIVLPSSGSVEPASGPSRGGTRVAILAPSGISGNQFNVLFSSNLARDVRFVAPNIITCITPPGSGTVDVSVTSSAVVAKVGTFTYR